MCVCVCGGGGGGGGKGGWREGKEEMGRMGGEENESRGGEIKRRGRGGGGKWRMGRKKEERERGRKFQCLGAGEHGGRVKIRMFARWEFLKRSPWLWFCAVCTPNMVCYVTHVVTVKSVFSVPISRHFLYPMEIE